ncbi:MAG: hypothetical protein AAF693_17135 [Bacteroidota bacterium]
MKNLNENAIDMKFKESGLACLLTDLEFTERKNELQKKIFSRVKKMEQMEDGYLFYFEDEEDLLADLFHYILAEKECCPFFRQDISVGTDNSGITWKISGSEEVKELLRQMLEGIEFSKH